MKRNILLIAFIVSFQVNAQTKPIEEFNFNGNRSNTENSNSFLGVSKFVTDRIGIANNAIRIVNSPMEITIPNLPISNKARSVSVWVKYNDISIPNYIWGYGSSFNAQYFGLVQQSTSTAKSDLNLASWGPTNDAIVTTAIATNTWYNYTVTFDGLTSKIYRNGTLIRSSISPRKLTSGTVFTIGKMGSSVSINADIDDLKIYDVALSPEEVLNLYEYSSVLAPNDVSELNSSIASVNNIADMKTDISTKATATKQEIILSTPKETVVVKSSEIFSTQGQKVISSNKNDIDISALPEGTYLLKVTNLNQNANSKKLTIK
jgi:hypothetical protein